MILQVGPSTQMGVSEKRGTLFWGPYNTDPAIQGTMLGSAIFGNSQIVEFQDPKTFQSMYFGTKNPAV